MERPLAGTLCESKTLALGCIGYSVVKRVPLVMKELLEIRESSCSILLVGLFVVLTSCTFYLNPLRERSLNLSGEVGSGEWNPRGHELRCPERYRYNPV